ncbi:MAG: Trk system potassium transporter TrkA [Oscillospiraceae bacterium]|nr:Trk system potassium transporter TrkA [Oscillospiraceae bacterium]
MKIVIAGAGKIGLAIARQMCAEGHDITLIDQRQDRLDKALNSLDVIGVCGNCSALSTLHEAEAGSADLFIAAAGIDEANLLACRLSGKLGAKHTVSILRNPEYMEDLDLLKEALDLGFSLHPDYVAAEEISRVLQFPAAVRVESFPDCELEIVSFRIEEGCRLSGIPLRQLSSRFGQKVLVCSVERNGNCRIPGGDFVLSTGDFISVTGTSTDLRRFFISAGVYRKPVKNVILLGGSRVAVHLARLLESTGVDVTIIEKDPERCNYLVEHLKSADIHCADGADTGILQLTGISRADGFVTLTGFDEDNIILAMYAAKIGVGKVLSKVNNQKFMALLEDVFPDTAVSPQALIAERIAGYVHALSLAPEKSTIEALYYLGDRSVTATEFVVGEQAACAGRKILEMPLRPGILIAAVIRRGRSFPPDGQTALEPGDKVIVVTANCKLWDLDDILISEGRKEHRP